MSIPYQMTSTIIAIAIAGIIFFLVRRDHMHGPYAVWWLCLAGGIVLLGFFPKLVDKLAQPTGCELLSHTRRGIRPRFGIDQNADYGSRTFSAGT